MRPSLLSLFGFLLAFAMIPANSADGQTYGVEVLKAAPPASLAPKVLESLNKEGFRVVDGEGKPYADLWFRKAVPALGAPQGTKGTIQFPFLTDGEFLGVFQYAAEGRDYRDQTIPKGVYTIRYGVQPIHGGHLGVSPFRDFALLLPAAEDTELADIAGKALHEKSAESAGATHPACLMLMKPVDPPASLPSIVHDQEKATWGANFPLKLGVKESTETFMQTIQFIVVGAAMG